MLDSVVALLMLDEDVDEGPGKEPVDGCALHASSCATRCMPRLTPAPAPAPQKCTSASSSSVLEGGATDASSPSAAQLSRLERCCAWECGTVAGLRRWGAAGAASSAGSAGGLFAGSVGPGAAAGVAPSANRLFPTAGGTNAPALKELPLSAEGPLKLLKLLKLSERPDVWPMKTPRARWCLRFMGLTSVSPSSLSTPGTGADESSSLRGLALPLAWSEVLPVRAGMGERRCWRGLPTPAPGPPVSWSCCCVSHASGAAFVSSTSGKRTRCVLSQAARSVDDSTVKPSACGTACACGAASLSGSWLELQTPPSRGVAGRHTCGSGCPAAAPDAAIAEHE